MVVGSPELDGAWNGRRPSYATTWRTIQCRSRPDRLGIDVLERRWRVKSSRMESQTNENTRARVMY